MPETQPSASLAPNRRTSFSVTVSKGSVSGAHTGELQNYSDGEGASYVLAAPLDEGESVDVVVDLAEGRPLEDNFSVAHLAPPEEFLKIEGKNRNTRTLLQRAHAPSAKVNVLKAVRASKATSS